MAINVGVVENEETHIDQVITALNEWEKISPYPIEYKTFQSGDAFLSSGNFEYDIIFLDIKLDDMDGIQVAKRLRDLDYDGHIVFLTGYKEYVFEGYNVRALNYLIKPITYEKIKMCMDVLLQSFSEVCYVYQVKGEVVTIPFGKILMFTSRSHYVEIVAKKERFLQLAKLKNVEPTLPDNFIRCHRTAIVNIGQVVQLKGENVTLSNGIVVPVSKPYMSKIKNTFILLAQGRVPE